MNNRITLEKLGFQTRCTHAGQEPDPTTGALTPPIYATSTYKQSSPGVNQGFVYGRGQNPTRSAYETAVASLEGGQSAFAFSSGVAGLANILELLPHQSHIITTDDLYGGTFRVFDKVKKITAGLQFTQLSEITSSSLESALQKNTKMIWMESPTNPMLKIVDLELVADFAKKHNLISVCDNTFATPYLQSPIKLGFDLVLHSATKYLNGHCDVIGGIVVTKSNDEINQRLAFLQNTMGAVPSPFDCFLINRGIKTLGIRMDRHCANTVKIVDYLSQHPKIEKIYYPGLESHPGYEVAKKQMKMPGAMLSVLVKADINGTRRFLENTKLFTLGESLGGVKSLIEHPAIMTHASIPAENRKALGILDNFVRISVGVEDVDDLIEDLKYALSLA